MKSADCAHQLILSLAIAGLLLALSACSDGGEGAKEKKPWPCLKELCKGEVTLADLDYSTATCEANSRACEFPMPAPHSFAAEPVSGLGCTTRAKCGDGTTCSTALAGDIRAAKTELVDERTNLLAGSNNACVNAPSPNEHPCVWTDPAPLPDPEFEADTPPAACTNNGCGNRCLASP